jgi:hypothetical protein
MAQRSEADAERRGELFLRQPGLFPHLFDIHLFGDEKPHAGFLPFSVSDGLFQPTLYALKKVAHFFPPSVLRAVLTHILSEPSKYPAKNKPMIEAIITIATICRFLFLFLFAFNLMSRQGLLQQGAVNYWGTGQVFSLFCPLIRQDLNLQTPRL